MASPALRPAADPVSILFVDPFADSHLPMLRRRFEVTAVTSEEHARRALRAYQPTLVITELMLPEGDGVSLCRESKAAFAVNAPAVLAVTSVTERVPEALKAGCDAVLVKPFAPNLLHARIGRLLRLRARAIEERAMWQRARSNYRPAEVSRITESTNVVFRDACCLSCGKGGVVGFDTASRGRMWYACLACDKVWIGPDRTDEAAGD
jgi:PleD family two-component response regulator